MAETKDLSIVAQLQARAEHSRKAAASFRKLLAAGASDGTQAIRHEENAAAYEDAARLVEAELRAVWKRLERLTRWHPHGLAGGGSMSAGADQFGQPGSWLMRIDVFGILAPLRVEPAPPTCTRCGQIESAHKDWVLDDLPGDMPGATGSMRVNRVCPTAWAPLPTWSPAGLDGLTQGAAVPANTAETSTAKNPQPGQTLRNNALAQNEQEREEMRRMMGQF